MSPAFCREGPRSGRAFSSRTQAGFTLLEVVIALAIMAVTIGALLEAQVSSLAAAGRSRDVTIATLLARSKMIDIEQKLFDEGFSVGDVEEQGNFGDEEQAEFTWKYRVMEIELDLSSIMSMASDGADSAAVEGAAAGAAGAGAGSMLGPLGGSIEPFMQEVGKSVRVIDLTVSWPDGKGTRSMSVRALISKEDLSLNPEGVPTGTMGSPGEPFGTSGAGNAGGGGSNTPSTWPTSNPFQRGGRP